MLPPLGVVLLLGLDSCSRSARSIRKVLEASLRRLDSGFSELRPLVAMSKPSSLHRSAC